jgi:hypothetical protein
MPCAFTVSKFVLDLPSTHRDNFSCASQQLVEDAAFAGRKGLNMTRYSVASAFIAHSWLASLVPALACPPGETGRLVIVDGEPTEVVVDVPSLATWKLSYNPSMIAVWDTPTKNNLVPPGTEYMAPAVVGDDDLDCDVDLRDVAEFQVCFTGDGGGILPDCSGFDTEPDGDVDFADFEIVGLDLRGPRVCVDTSLAFYVEGLIASTTLCDTALETLADSDGDGVFESSQVSELTVVEVTLAPTSGPVGTPVTVSLTPAITPLAFDAATTATWAGVYDPAVGDPSPPLQVTYSAAQFREISADEAIIVIGDGAVTDAPDFGETNDPGVLVGQLTLVVAAGEIRVPFDFAPEFDAARWEDVNYPDGPGGAADPMLDGEPTDLPVLLLTNTPNPLNPSESFLLNANGFHVAAVVRVEENPTTVASAPTTLNVDLVSYDSQGIEIDRVFDLMLERVLGDDGDPNNLIYHNDLDTPIVLVDVDLSGGSYPSVVPLHVLGGGSAVIVPAAD